MHSKIKWRFKTPCEPFPHSGWRKRNGKYECQVCDTQYEHLVDQKTGERVK